MTERRAPRVTDAAIASGTWVFACVILLLLPLLVASDSGSHAGVAPVRSPGWWLAVAALSLQSIVLLWARAAPRAALVVVCALPLLAATAVDVATFSVTRTAVIVAVFLAGLVVPARRIWAALAAAAALITAGEAINQTVGGHSDVVAALGLAVAQTLVILVAPLTVAFMFAARREARDAHLNELHAVARERDALVSAAVSKERAAMARELHDIAAHHLSGIAIMAAAVERQIPTDPEAARRSVRQVRVHTKAVLDDLRRLVGLLRDDADTERPVQTLATVADLVADKRAAGTDVEMRAYADADGREFGEGIGPLAQLVAYRMVQESLTNAVTHAAGAPCRVEVDDRGAAELVVTVRNERPSVVRPGAPPRAGGFGLLGMRERAALVSGHLRYGTAPDGGWQVILTIPRDRQNAIEALSPSDPEVAT